MKKPPSTFAARLATLREAAGLSVADLAVKAGVSRQNMHRLEAGDRLPSWETVQKLSAALGVSTEEFRSGD